MSKFLLSFFLLTLPFLAFAQQPLYLDDSQPIERRIDDAMSRMTLQEKINILRRRSISSMHKVSSPRAVFPAWAFPISGPTMVLTACVPTCSGMNGNRLDRPTTRVWPSPR